MATLRNWSIKYLHVGGGGFGPFEAYYNFVTDSSFTPMEALRVGLGEIQAKMKSFYTFNKLGEVEKLP